MAPATTTTTTRPPSRFGRWALVCGALLVFGAGPAAAVLATSERAGQPWPLLEAEARGRAQLLDAAAELWRRGARDRAQELAALLAQLPDAISGLAGKPDAARLGKAAEGTLLLYLERKLAEDRDMARYLVVTPGGRVALAVGKGGVALADELPEVAQAAQRPALLLLRGARPGAALAAAAPLVVRGKLVGLLVARVRDERVARLLPPAEHGLRRNLVDASGVALAACPGCDLARLGSEAGPGRVAVGGSPAAYQPLETARAVVLVLAPPAVDGGGAWRWVGLGVLAALAALVAAALTRR